MRPFPNSNTSLNDLFTIERHGEVMIVVPTRLLESFDSTQLDDAAELLTAPLRDATLPLVLVDLSAVDYFGSSFLTLLLRCWRVVQGKGGQMVLSGLSPRARELLHLTSLDIVWPIYTNRAEAIDALDSD